MKKEKSKKQIPTEIGSLYNIIGELKNTTSTDNDTKAKFKILSLVLDQSHISIAILSREGVVEYANPKLMKLYNLPPAKIIGKNWKSFLSDNSTLWKKSPEIRKNVVEKGIMWKGEVSDKAVSGETVWRAVTIFPVKNEQG